MAKASMSPPLSTIGMSFAEVLGAWDEGRLSFLLALRPDLSRPPPASLAELVRRAGSWPSIQQARWHLDRGAQQVLDAACLLPAPPTVSGLTRLLGGAAPIPGLSEALERLEGWALLIRRGDALVLAPGLSDLPNPARLGPPVREALATQQASTLSSMARRLGVRPGANRGATLDAVAAALADPARIQVIMSAAPGEAAQVARMAAIEGPAVSVRNGVYGLSDRTPAGWLVSHGLLAPMSWDLLVMPREVALILRGGKPFPSLELTHPEVTTTEVDQGAIDRAAAEAAIRLVADVRTILDMWGQAEPAVLKDGGIGVRELKRAAKAIERTELETAQIIEIAAAAGLVPSVGPGGRVLPRTAYDRWLSAEIPERWVTLVRGWLDCHWHPSLSGVLDDRSKPIPTLLIRAEAQALPRRELVMGVFVMWVPSGFAILPDCVERAADWLGPDLWAGGPARPETLRRWALQESALVGMLVDGAMSSFGRAVARGWARGLPGGGAPASVGAAAAASRTAFQEAASMLAQWAPPVSSTFVVQADLTAVAPGELSAAVRSELELLADVESKGAATVYRFSETSLRRGFDAGRGVDSIMVFLESHATRGVPQALAYLVGDIGRRFGSLRVGSATCYVRCEDPAVVSEILAARRGARLGLRQLAPTVLVSATDAPTTLGVLRAIGYLPALEDPAGELVVIDAAPGRAQAAAKPSWASPVPDPAALAAKLRKAAGPPLPPAAGPPPPAAASPAAARAGAPDPGRPIPALPPGMSRALAESLSEIVNGLFGARQGGSTPKLPGRPVTIAKDRASILDLLERAYDEEWMVRLGYRARNGRSSQLSAMVLAVEDEEVVLECAPRWTDRALSLDQIDWIRVMTEAEEDALP